MNDGADREPVEAIARGLVRALGGRKGFVTPTLKAALTACLQGRWSNHTLKAGAVLGDIVGPAALGPSMLPEARRELDLVLGRLR